MYVVYLDQNTYNLLTIFKIIYFDAVLLTIGRRSGQGIIST